MYERVIKRIFSYWCIAFHVCRRKSYAMKTEKWYLIVVSISRHVCWFQHLVYNININYFSAINTLIRTRYHPVANYPVHKLQRNLSFRDTEINEVTLSCVHSFRICIQSRQVFQRPLIANVGTSEAAIHETGIPRRTTFLMIHRSHWMRVFFWRRIANDSLIADLVSVALWNDGPAAVLERRPRD